MAVLLALLHLHFYRLVIAGPRPGLLAVTDTGEQTVTLYEYPHEPPALVRKIAYYELGHVLDVDCLTNAQRRYWQHLRHLHGSWYAPDLTPEQRYGSGDFADVYSRYMTGPAYFQGHLRSARDLRSLAVRFHFTRGVCR